MMKSVLGRVAAVIVALLLVQAMALRILTAIGDAPTYPRLGAAVMIDPARGHSGVFGSSIEWPV